MPETPDVPLEDTKELSIDEKLDKLLTSATVVTQLKTDIDTMTTSVKGLTEDLNKLKKNTDAIPNIRSQLKQIQEDVTSLKNENTTTKIQINKANQRLKALEEENVELKSSLDSLKSKIRRETNIEERSLEDKITKHMQRQQDKNSLIIEGVPESLQENLNKIVQEIAYDTGIQVHDKEITEVYRLGKFNKKDKRPRSIKFTLTTRSQRNNIYRNRMSIKQNPACADIWINECLDEEQKRKRAEVKAVVHLAQSLNKEARAVADIAIIQGIRYDHHSFHTLPIDLTLEKAFDRELHGNLYFNSEHSPLSSFHPAVIEYKEQSYVHIEQGFQHQKAVEMKNEAIAQKILKTTDPRECKALGKLVTTNDHWNDNQDEVMEDLVNLKVQIPNIREFLIKTGDRNLVESTGDTYWGCGASFGSTRVQENKTIGKNKLGKIWTTCRNQIIADTTGAETNPQQLAPQKAAQTDDVMPPLEGEN